MAEAAEREEMEVDVVIVGAGPAGLSAAIRLRQLAAEAGEEISVVVLEKGSEVGAHILSGAVIDPVGLDRLLPDWRADPETPVKTQVSEDHFLVLGHSGAARIPNAAMPRLMSNHGNFVVSLGDTMRWLGAKAEAHGVEIYPGFPAADVLTDEAGRVTGVVTGDLGVARDGQPRADFTRGMALKARYTLIGEGARGSLAKGLIARFGLSKDREPQKYGIGLKELWEVPKGQHKPGLVQHTFGWPLDRRTSGGSFVYHFGDNLVSVGFVVGLNYRNPYLAPFEEFQRFKTHEAIRPHFDGGRRIGYGARVIAQGGYQAVPKLTFPGGALIGCSAGFVNVPRIKGTHNAMLSGMLAAEHVFAALAEGRAHDEVEGYESGWRDSDVGRDLWRVRNVKPFWSRYGTLGVALAGVDMWTNERANFSLFGTRGHAHADHEALEPASKHKPIVYPKPDGVLTFDKLSSVFLSNTNHEEDQPSHLKVLDMDLQKTSEHDIYAGPSQRYCPAGVYEWLEEATGPRFQINAQNCVHCKTCDIKDPNQNIVWVPPEGGGGPNYSGL